MDDQVWILLLLFLSLSLSLSSSLPLLPSLSSSLLSLIHTHTCTKSSSVGTGLQLTPKLVHRRHCQQSHSTHVHGRVQTLHVRTYTQVQPSPCLTVHTTLAKGGGQRLPENKQCQDFVPRLLSMPSTGKALFLRLSTCGWGEVGGVKGGGEGE